MIGRRQIREKVLQTIYAHTYNEIPVESSKKNLLSVIDNVALLYVFQLNLLLELKYLAQEKIENRKKKNFRTTEDENPNLKFVNNLVLQSIEENQDRIGVSENHKEISWTPNYNYVNSIYKKLVDSDAYEKYMRNEINEEVEDADFIIKIFDKYIADNESLHELYEQMQLSWSDDFHIANSMTFKTLKYLSSNLSSNTLIKTFKDDEDKLFAEKLLVKTITFKQQFYDIIKERTIGWEMDRVALLDKIILSMAFCEIIHMKTPSFVAINEYIEIAKTYSIPKSKIYINGILDKYIKENNLVNEVPKDYKLKDLKKTIIVNNKEK
ncbi:MAG: transcription antitermination protein NusB [Flavobacteriales bacterium]|nr:transcription antitermination protein NusB [Flavobacteriales bacterium]